MKLGRIILVVTLIIVMIGTVGCAGQNQQAAPEGTTQEAAPAKSSFIRLGTAQLGGGTYNNGLAFASATNLGLTDYKLEALPTSGAVESARMLLDKEVEMACMGNDALFDIHNGRGRYEGKGSKEIRLMFPQFINYVNIAVPKNSSINSFDDMKGKRVGVGNPGSAGYYLITHMMRAHGLSEKDYMEDPLSPAEQTTALRDGHLDVFGFYTTPNSPPVVELATTMDVRFVDVDKAKWDAYCEENGLPFIVATTPAGTYKGMDKDTLQVAGMNSYVATADMSEEMAYEIVKSFFEHYEEAMKIVPAIKQTKELLPIMKPVVPWHPGAIKYFKEAGLEYVEFES